jgi:multicomponent Na+:H+ antiporter subunit F
VNLWLWAAAALSLGLLLCSLILLRGEIRVRLIGQQLAAQIVVLVLILIGVGTRQPFVLDLALSVALLSAAGTLLFARFLERWL